MSIFATHICDRAGRLDCLREVIQASTTKCEKLLPTNLPFPAVDVIYYVNENVVMPELGFSGYAPSSSIIQIALDSRHAALVENIESDLSYILAHEIHHCLRWKGPGYGGTLIEALVSEGLACELERSLRGRLPPYLPTLSQEVLDRLLDQARREFTDSSYSYSDWFFGSKIRGIPPRAGYSLGLHIVDRYMEQSDASAAILYQKKGLDFLTIFG